VTLLRDLLAEGWLQNFLIGIVTLFITPFIGQFIDGRRGEIIGFALGLTILIWILTSVWIRRILKTSKITGQSKTLQDYLVLPIGLTILILLLALVTIQRVSKAPGNSQRTKTLYDYFISDSTLLRIGEAFTMSSKQSSETVEIEFNLHLDFDAKSEFISFYIPSIHWTNVVCDYIAREGYKLPLNLKKKVIMEAHFPTQRGVHTDELKFNGSVFIYHESPLFDSEKDTLIPIFKSNGLSPQFRGVDYVFFKNNPPIKPRQTFPEK
jgi:hypothetical protein